MYMYQTFLFHRLCGNTQHPVVLQSMGNAVMIILHAENNEYFGSGFEAEFSTGMWH